MEIDSSIVELMRTCLKEEWGTNVVSDVLVKTMIEMTLYVAIMHDMEQFDLPRTTEAMSKYLEERGIPVGDFDYEEGDSDEKEIRENEVEFKETPYSEENA